MRLVSARLASVPVVAALLLRTTIGYADVETCVSQHSTGQREAKAGHLREAAELFLACSSDEGGCPDVLKTECLRLLDETRSTTPTVILSAQDEHGRDLSEVQVFSGDELVADGLDGRPLPLNPGRHQLRFVLPSGEELASDVVVREGEKNRIVQVASAKETNEESAAAITSDEPPVPAPDEPGRKRPVAAWVLSGVAVAGAGVFGTFAILGNGARQDLNECSPACDPSKQDTLDRLRTSYLVADVGLGVAVASGVTASILFLSHGKREKPAARDRSIPLTVTAIGDVGGGRIVLSRSFF